MPSTRWTSGEFLQAAYHAVVDLQTWIPLAGAAAVFSSDHKVSGWATGRTPICGSHNGTENVDTTVLPVLRGGRG